MLELYLPLFGVLSGAGLALATVLVLGARYGPHRMWQLSVFITCVALVVGSGILEYGIPILFDEVGFRLPLSAVARASLASAVTIQSLRATRAPRPWQVGAGTAAGEATLFAGTEFMDGC